MEWGRERCSIRCAVLDKHHCALGTLGILGGMVVDIACVSQTEPTAVEIEQIGCDPLDALRSIDG